MKCRPQGNSLLIKLSKKEKTLDWKSIAQTIPLSQIQQLEILASEQLAIDSFPPELNSLHSLILSALELKLQEQDLLQALPLKKFKLSGCSIEHLPNLNLKTLLTLYCPRNKLTHLAPLSSNQTPLALSELDLGQNKLEHLEIDFTYLPHLKRINLEGNQLEQLPSSLFQLKELTHLSLKGNPLSEETKQKVYDAFKIVFEN